MTAVVIFIISVFIVGYFKGYNIGVSVSESEMEDLLRDKISSVTKPAMTPEPSNAPTQKPTAVSEYVATVWGGPELWEVVNKSRVEHGVNALAQRDELCTIASIRLNELLELGKLDGHEGFSKLPETRTDLKWIFEKYTISEFLVSGAASAQEAVDLWLNTLGHKKLLTGGEYVWGCTYAQNGFGVAIAAYE